LMLRTPIFLDQSCLVALQYLYATSVRAANVKLIRLGAAQRLTENAIRVLGGVRVSCVREVAVCRYHRDVLFCIIGEEARGMQRNFIARELRA
jgi:alkylation response protein AidB-like acyl-CoA dehydrogenase